MPDPDDQRPAPDFTGFVLMGGSSRRMGQDKAFLRLEGRPLVERVLSVLPPAGAGDCYVVGGDLVRFAELGLPIRGIPDHDPGEGPLAGMLSVADDLRPPERRVLVFVSCDLPSLRSANIRRLVEHLLAHPDADAAVPVVDGVWQTHVVALRAGCLAAIGEAFGRGERSVRRALRGLATVTIEDSDAAAYRDLDSPEDVADYARAVPPGPQRRRPDRTGDTVDLPEIDTATLASLLEEGALVLDVRNPDEYEDAHVAGAVLVPLPDLAERLDDVPDTAGAPLYVICAVGGRSARAAEYLRAQGIDAVNVAGGTRGWIDEGRPTVTGAEPG